MNSDITKQGSCQATSTSNSESIIQATPGLTINLDALDASPEAFYRNNDDLIIRYPNHSIIVENYYKPTIIHATKPIAIQLYTIDLLPENFQHLHTDSSNTHYAPSKTKRTKKNDLQPSIQQQIPGGTH